jgi:hypothetical protein
MLDHIIYLIVKSVAERDVIGENLQAHRVRFAQWEVATGPHTKSLQTHRRQLSAPLWQTSLEPQ